MIPIEYIWLGGNGEFRSKVRYFPKLSYHSLPDQIMNSSWNYDGSSTGQATTENSEVLLKPARVYSNQAHTKYYVLCETYRHDGTPLENNYRHGMVKKLQSTDAKDLHIWFGFEQEFFIYDLLSNTPIGADTFEDIEQGPFYCNIEAVELKTSGKYIPNTHRIRKITELIAAACVDLQLGITGWNLEVAPGQTEVQIFGDGLKACDDLMMFRYLCHQLLLEHQLMPNFSPKPLGEKFNGSGLHTNISTAPTRQENGYDVILDYMKKFEKTHKDHIEVYGKDNHLRLTGIHETSSMDTFTWGVGSRATSVRIPRETEQNKRGYFEDRRPASNANPYQIGSRILETLCMPSLSE